jgi:16S rRNA processing protein RimM
MSTSTSSTDERPEGLLEVGRIRRPHGVRGDLYVDLITQRTERLAPGSRLYGRERWLVVARSAVHPPRFIVHFEGVDDREVAAGFTGARLYAEPVDGDADELWVHELIGAEVIDQHGISRGRCVAVVDNPAHDLLELESGLLVPVPFVRGLADGVITVDVPEGLFEVQG